MAPRCRQLALCPAVLFALKLMPFEAAHAEQLRLAWDANTEVDLAGYRLYVGESSGVPDRDPTRYGRARAMNDCAV